MQRLLFFSAFIFLFPLSLLAQQTTVKGKIISSDDGQGLPGVSVFIKGTTTGTITDYDGNYTVNIEENSEALVYSYVGYKSQEIQINGRSVIDVVLELDTKQLEEVVVTGFQEVDRKLFTGAAERISMEDIKAAGIPDASRALEGQVAGVSVDNVSGTFGTSPKIRIRGNTSINGNNQPLFVVDGVILEELANVDTEDFISGNANTLVSSSMANLNPNDIESFEVLKDASATAIYGARAANGVIVITTKRGRSGKLQVNYTGNFSVKLRPTYNQFNLLNSAEEMSVYREMQQKGLIDITTSVKAQNFGAMGKMYSLIANHELDWGPGGSLNEEFLNQYENANTDWFDLLFRDYGLQQQHSLSFTTGNEKSNNYYSVSYLGDQGQTIADNVRRFTGTARNTYFLSDKFTFGLKLTASFRDQQAPGTRNREFDPITGQYSRGFDVNPYSYAINTSRSIRALDENGNREYFRRNYAPFNILDELAYNYIDINVVDVSAQTDFEIRPIESLSIKGVFQGRYASSKTDHTVHENSNQAEAYRANQTQFIQESNNLLFRDPNNPGLNPVVVLPQGGFKYLDQSNLSNFFSRVSAEWSKKFKNIHDVNILAGNEIRYTNRSSTSSTGMGVVYESGGVVVTDPNIIEFYNLQDIDYFSLNEEKDRFIGFFFNGGYAYKSRYVGNFIVRYDGSNQLGESDQARFLPTWNVSGAWNVNEEPFFKSLTSLNNLFDYFKIRATYGISGNLPPESSALLNLQADITIRPTDVEPYLYILDLANTELTWEKLKEFNVGMDFSMFDERFSAYLNYYNRLGFDLIGNVQTSGIGGQGLKTGNFADLSAWGYEVTLNSVNLRKSNFSWTTNVNLGYTFDKITRLDFGPRLVDAINAGGAAVLGGPRRGLYSTRFSGLNSQGIPEFYDANGEVVYQYDLQSREDLNATLQYEGPTEPRMAGGFSNVFNYKNLSLTVLLSFKFDYKVRLNDAFKATYTDFDALPAELINRWAVPGDEDKTNIPVILDRGVAQSNGDVVLAYDLYNKSGLRVANGDYVRLRTVSLNYSLPSQISSKLGLTFARVALEGQNLALLYSDKALKGQDPEFFRSGGVALPQPRLITVSLNVGF